MLICSPGMLSQGLRRLRGLMKSRRKTPKTCPFSLLRSPCRIESSQACDCGAYLDRGRYEQWLPVVLVFVFEIHSVTRRSAGCAGRGGEKCSRKQTGPLPHIPADEVVSGHRVGDTAKAEMGQPKPTTGPQPKPTTGKWQLLAAGRRPSSSARLGGARRGNRRERESERSPRGPVERTDCAGS